jgi:hypothetical protein
MTAADFIGNAIAAFLVGGFSYALVDLFVRIVRQPKQPFNMLKLSSYPLVPDDEQSEMSPEEGTDGLRLSPVPIKSDQQ